MLGHPADNSPAKKVFIPSHVQRSQNRSCPYPDKHFWQKHPRWRDWIAFCRQFCGKWQLLFNERLQPMKVFVAGASGAIGRPLVAALVAAKHEVIGMTSRDSGIRALREKGAEGVVVNA